MTALEDTAATPVTAGAASALEWLPARRCVARHSERANGLQASTVIPIGKHNLPPTETVRG
jgi:hypothetical protein